MYRPSHRVIIYMLYMGIELSGLCVHMSDRAINLMQICDDNFFGGVCSSVS
jgi:hypothetical protein